MQAHRDPLRDRQFQAGCLLSLLVFALLHHLACTLFSMLTMNGHSSIVAEPSIGMVKSASNSSLLGGSRSSAPLLTRKGSHGGPNSRLSTHMFVAQAGPVTTGAGQSVEEYRMRKVALITGQCALMSLESRYTSIRVEIAC